MSSSSIRPHNLTFPNPGLFKRQFYPPPPSLFPSHSLPKPSDSHSLFSRCHATSDSSSSDNSVSRRWDSALQDLLNSAVQRFDSYFGPKKEEESIVVDDGEWDWDRWKKHFEEVDQQERLVSVLKAQLIRAVSREDYEDAGRLKVAIAAATRSDTVGRAMSYFKRAIKDERYGDAAFMRDDAGAGLVGWWAGTSKDSLDPYGIIIRITAEHGRYVARSYSPRQLVSAASGVPLFEVFLQANKKGKYKQQAVYLKRREGRQDSFPNSSRWLSKTSNISPLDSTEGSSDILVTSTEEEDDSDGIDNDSDLPDPEDMPRSQSIARDMIPGVKVKVLKVTAPSKVDRDLIARVIEQMIDEDDEGDDFEVEGLDTDDEDKGESDQEKDEVELNAGPGVSENGGKNEFAVKVVVGGLVQRLSNTGPMKELLRVPAKLVKKSCSSFSFTIDKDVNEQEHNGKKWASLDAEGKLRSRRSIDHVMLDLAKFIGGEKIPLKVLKDVGELISLTLSQAQNHRQLSGSTTFKRIEIPTNLDPLNGLYIGAHGIYTSEVIHLRRKFGQWQEDSQTKNQPNLEFYEYVEALKLIGDRYVPAGQVAFRAKIGKRYQLPHKGIIPEELGVIARYKGQGRLAEPGFQNPRWVDGELVILDGKYIKGGPVVGFVYWAPEYHFLVFFNRLQLQE